MSDKSDRSHVNIVPGPHHRHRRRLVAGLTLAQAEIVLDWLENSGRAGEVTMLDNGLCSVRCTEQPAAAVSSSDKGLTERITAVAYGLVGTLRGVAALLEFGSLDTKAAVDTLRYEADSGLLKMLGAKSTTSPAASLLAASIDMAEAQRAAAATAATAASDGKQASHER